VNAYLKAISGAGTNAAGTSSTQPIFGNPLTSALSGATGILGLGKELGLGSGLKSLFGGGADAGALLSGDYGGGGILGDVAAETFAPAASSAGKGASSFLPAIFA
jgi:hypothetical protein